MANNSSIEWTEATWNPTTGCTKISTGCKNCYAETLSKRLKAMGLAKYRNNFEFTQHESDIDIPLRWKKPRRIFVNSMSDLFHKKADNEFITKCFETMVLAHWHTYQVLTKRPSRMAQFSKIFFEKFKFHIPSYIWMGTSVEDKQSISRIQELRNVKCGMKFVSFEPLLGNVGSVNLSKIDWVIIGGESGHHHRSIKEEWIQNLIQQCRKQRVSIFFKQWGGAHPKSGGREINGRTYSEYPKKKPISSTKEKSRIVKFRKEHPLFTLSS